jgi:hypothetical protein
VDTAVKRCATTLTPHTGIECATNGGDDDLNGGERTKAKEDITILVIDSVEADDMDN